MRGAVVAVPAVGLDSAVLAHLRERLVALVPGAVGAAETGGEAVLVSAACRAPSIDPITLFAGSAEACRSCWQDTGRGLAIVGLGAADRFEHTGAGGGGALRRHWQRLIDRAAVDNAGCPLDLPLALTGIAFDPHQTRSDAWRRFPDAELVIPRLAMVTTRHGAWLVGNAVVGSSVEADAALEDLDRVAAGRQRASRDDASALGSPTIRVNGRTRWAGAVEAARTAIRAGGLDKVVLAREVCLRAAAGFVPGPSLRRLRARYPQCTLFAVARDGDVFLGASPEALVRLDHGLLEASCLAGSRRRGTSPGADAAEGASLLADPKERHEHALVLEALRSHLGRVCDRLEIPERPGLLRMANVQHLHTRLSGVTCEDLTLLDLVELLHPTPATAGEPREPALDFIRDAEPFARGWYAGVVGWLGPSAGEAVVAIRSALLHGGQARLYAGCGIVADSDPTSEYSESCLKLEPMLWALGGR